MMVFLISERRTIRPIYHVSCCHACELREMKINFVFVFSTNKRHIHEVFSESAYGMLIETPSYIQNKTKTKSAKQPIILRKLILEQNDK